MHYADGTPAKMGDLVYKPSTWTTDSEIIGILVSGTAQSTSCNGSVEVVAVRHHSDLGESGWRPAPNAGNGWCVTVSDLLPMPLPVLPAPDPDPSESASAS
jgi:hypothetical protein